MYISLTKSLLVDVVTSSGEFHEVDGEPEERRRARLNRHMRMNARMVCLLVLNITRLCIFLLNFCPVIFKRTIILVLLELIVRTESH